MRLHTHSEDETVALGVRLAATLESGDVIGLHGELGAGKTVFVRGLAQALGIAERKVRSPTFTLINEYHGGRLPLYHIDLYRMAPSALDRLALREYLFGDGVCVIEWFERFGEDLPHLSVAITFVGEEEREIVVTPHGDRYGARLDKLGARLDKLKDG